MKKNTFKLVIWLTVSVIMVGCGEQEHEVKNKSESIFVGEESETGEVAEELSTSEEHTEEPDEEEVSEQESSETVEPNDVSTEVFSEEIEDALEENPTKRFLTDEDVKVIILDEYGEASVKAWYDSADLQIVDALPINEDIVCGTKLHSDRVRKFLTWVYEDAGCTSHEVIEEYFAINEVEMQDYSLLVETPDGMSYGMIIAGDWCYANKFDYVTGE